MNRKVIIGSRGSDLALWQANHVKKQLFELDINSEIQVIKTKGDVIKDLSFDKIEGKGFFTKEIEEALLNHSIDLAVHSHKDLETNPPKGLVVAAVSERENPSELLLIRKEKVDNTKFWSLKQGAVVGTSSSRRKSQMLLFRNDVKLKELRGNVPTRIQKLRDGHYDAIIIAFAGVARLNLDVSDLFSVKLSKNWLIPAPAQGVLGIQVREGDLELIEALKNINSSETQRNIEFERKVLNLLNGGCQLPLGVYCETENDTIKSWVSMASSFNDIPFRLYKEGSSPEQIVEQLISEKSKSNKVLITRELTQDSLFLRLLEKQRFEVDGQSLIQIEFLKKQISGDFNWIFFNSSNAVESCANQVSKMMSIKIGAMGTSTALKLKEKGLDVDFIGKGSPENVAEDFSKTLGNQKVLFPVSDKSIGTIQKKIHPDQLLELVTYKNNAKSIQLKNYDVIVFTSPSNVYSFFNCHKLSDEKVVAIGLSTERALKDNGVNEVIVSWESSELALADAVSSLN